MTEMGTQVWLHFVHAYSDDILVGFSSLGRIPGSPSDVRRKWNLAVADDPVTLGFIPMLAVSISLQGKTIRGDVESVDRPLLVQEPTEKTGRHYSDWIMEHVLTQARRAGFASLGLLVHSENKKAIAFYKRFKFQIIGPKNERSHLKMFLRL